MRLTFAASFLGGFYLCLLVWWIVIQITGIHDSLVNLGFAFAYGLIPIIGGILGLQEASRWGMLKSSMGKAIIFLSLGLITWGFGEMIWSFYNFILKVEVPYPSWADASFILSWPLWSVGVLYLSQATGAKFGLKTIGGRIALIAIPLAGLILSYYLLVVVARQGSFEISGGIVKIFFDLAYPIGDVVILTLGVLIYGLSFQFLGGVFKWPVLIILSGFVVNYFADFGFSYTTTVETFYNGNWVDLLFASAMSLMSVGVNSLEVEE